ncbi:helix-turn-helix domain-containing protein, partial [Aeromonas hydrophila]
LPLPTDPRLGDWLQQLKRGDALPERLNQLAGQIGASDKTIGRIFMRETGMSYQAWRQQWRLLRGMELLAEGQSISRISSALEFSSDSAFISFFR